MAKPCGCLDSSISWQSTGENRVSLIRGSICDEFACRQSMQPFASWLSRQQPPQLHLAIEGWTVFGLAAVVTSWISRQKTHLSSLLQAGGSKETCPSALGLDSFKHVMWTDREPRSVQLGLVCVHCLRSSQRRRLQPRPAGVLRVGQYVTPHFSSESKCAMD